MRNKVCKWGAFDFWVEINIRLIIFKLLYLLFLKTMDMSSYLSSTVEAFLSVNKKILRPNLYSIYL